jgi:hypothetical protein
MRASARVHAIQNTLELQTYGVINNLELIHYAYIF